jgi:hypothetical protein
VSDAHTVVTRAWAGPHGITWNLGMRNVPEDSSPFLVVGGVKGGTVCRGWGNYRGVTELSFFLSHLPNPAPLFLNFRPLSLDRCVCPFPDLCPHLSVYLCPLLFLGPVSLSVSPPPTIPVSLGPCPLSSNLSSRSLWISAVWLSIPSSLRLGGSLRYLLTPSPFRPVFPWPTGLLKEKERKAVLPAATVPGPGLETAVPADAPVGVVGGGGSPRGRPGAVPGPSLLAPLLWERTLPFGDVEYVDLDAFLLEHGLPPSPPPPAGGPSPAPSPARTPAPSPGPGSCGSASPRSSPGHAPARAALGASGVHRAGAARGRGLGPRGRGGTRRHWGRGTQAAGSGILGLIVLKGPNSLSP